MNEETRSTMPEKWTGDDEDLVLVKALKGSRGYAQRGKPWVMGARDFLPWFRKTHEYDFGPLNMGKFGIWLVERSAAGIIPKQFSGPPERGSVGWFRFVEQRKRAIQRLNNAASNPYYFPDGEGCFKITHDRMEGWFVDPLPKAFEQENTAAKIRNLIRHDMDEMRHTAEGIPYGRLMPIDKIVLRLVAEHAHLQCRRMLLDAEALDKQLKLVREMRDAGLSNLDLSTLPFAGLLGPAPEGEE